VEREVLNENLHHHFLSFDFLNTFEKMPPSFFVDGEAEDPEDEAATLIEDEEEEETEDEGVDEADDVFLG